MGGRFSAGRLTRVSLLASAALLLSYVESLFPLPIAVPGIKLGLANSLVLAALYLLGEKEALFVSVTRVTLAGMLFSSPMSTVYSLAGALLSFCSMALLKRINHISVTAVSIAGALAHNLAQVALAALILGTPELFTYLPPLLLAGVVTGFLTGAVVAISLKHIKPYLG